MQKRKGAFHAPNVYQKYLFYQSLKRPSIYRIRPFLVENFYAGALFEQPPLASCLPIPEWEKN
jgi:hypothetical protein